MQNMFATSCNVIVSNEISGVPSVPRELVYTDDVARIVDLF